jgi:uncharacterized Zn finger protein
MSGNNQGWRDWKPTRRREAEGGIKARSRSGQIGTTWWSQRWLGVLESFGWSNRLGRGRSYARTGQVLDFKIDPGRVTARVQGSRPKPYEVSIKLKTLNDGQWNAVIRAMSSRAAFAAQLLSGAMAREVEDVFRRARVPLFPQSGRDFDADCSCPDIADVCKHIAAVHYILAEQFDRDPFMIFALRGRSRDEVLSALRRARGGQAPQAPAPREPAAEAEPLLAEGFWSLGPAFTGIRVAPVPPAVDLSVLRRLGDPPFARGRPERMQRLQAIYQAVSARALDLASR